MALLDTKESRAAYTRIIRTWSTARVRRSMAPVVTNIIGAPPRMLKRRNGLLWAELCRRRDCGR